MTIVTGPDHPSNREPSGIDDGLRVERDAQSEENAAAGVHYYTDSGGRLWRIRVFEIGHLARFMAYALTTLHDFRNQLGWTLLFREMLMHPGPEVGWKIRFRRWAGLSDYSARYIKKHVRFTDAVKIREACFKANWGEEYDKVVADAKKKVASVGLGS